MTRISFPLGDRVLGVLRINGRAHVRYLHVRLEEHGYRCGGSVRPLAEREYAKTKGLLNETKMKGLYRVEVF